MGDDLNKKGLGIPSLVAFSIGTTLASGVFSMVGDFAANGAYTGAVLIGWLIAGIGMFGLAMSFLRLSEFRPELKSGIFSYARAGFGEYIGFNIAWGYWMSALLAQVAFVSLFFASVGYFLPAFGLGNNALSIIVGSVITWLLFLLLSRGINQAVLINAIVVIAKLIPIVAVILAILFARVFDWEIFTNNFWGESSGISVLEQVKATTYVTVWIFIGIEGAVVISGRAKRVKDAGKATIISFLGLLVIYAVISLLGMGVMPAEQLAKLGNPRMAGLLEYVVGPWGAVLVNIAVMISIGGALLSYTILATDSAFQPAAQACFPKIFAKENGKKAPISAGLITTIAIQIFLIIVYFNESSYQVVYTLSTSAIMFPYFFSALYLFKIVAKNDNLNHSHSSKGFTWIVTIIGFIYGCWLLYASGWVYILVSALLYAPGTILYILAKKERGLRLFPCRTDLIAFIVTMVAFVASILLTTNGILQPF